MIIQPHMPQITVFEVVVTLVLGLCLGSFATALAWRLPRDESIVRGGDGKSKGKSAAARSRCPKCKTVLGLRDLVPVLSWLFSRGKCRHCGVRVSATYPLMETATAVLCLLFLWRFGFAASVVPLFFVAPVLVAITDIDFRFTIIPDVLNLSLALLAFATLGLMAWQSPFPWLYLKETGADMLLAMAVYGGGIWLVRLVAMVIMRRDPLGLGDVKFFAAVGPWLGLHNLPYFMMFSGLSGVALALIWQKATGSREFPFGPSLILAYVLVMLMDGGIFHALS